MAHAGTFLRLHCAVIPVRLYLVFECSSQSVLASSAPPRCCHSCLDPLPLVLSTYC